jgi:RNA polymerase sigma-70 factor, ECF subfamily
MTASSARDAGLAVPPTDEFRDQMVAIIPSLRAFARGLCGHRELADDLAQEAMMRAWAARDSFTMGTNFRAWMFMILRNQFYTTMRKNSRMSSWDPEAAERLLVEAAPQQHAIHLSDVESALQKLPFEQREILLLVGAGGATYEEAAEITGCAIGTVKSRLARGRVALAALINGPDDLIETMNEPAALRMRENKADRPAERLSTRSA